MKSSNPKSTVQGEGDYASARKYNEKGQAFAKSGKVEQAAQHAAPRNAQDQADLLKAEAEGRSHAKGGSAHSGQGDGSAPGRPKPDKRAPGKQPQGRTPTPEKFPGR